MRIRPRLLFLREHWEMFFLSAMALALAFGLGWYAHTVQIQHQQEESFPGSVAWTAQRVLILEGLYDIRVRSSELDTPINLTAELDVAQLRSSVDQLVEYLFALNVAHYKPYPEAYTYILELRNYLLRANYTDYCSLEPTFSVAWPLVNGADRGTIQEALEQITENLATEQGQAAWEILDPTGSLRPETSKGSMKHE